MAGPNVWRPWSEDDSVEVFDVYRRYEPDPAPQPWPPAPSSPPKPKPWVIARLWAWIREHAAPSNLLLNLLNLLRQGPE